MNKQKNIFKNTGYDFLKGALLPVFFTGAVIAIIVSGLQQAEASAGAEGLRILDEGIRRAVVMSYAIEGRYPPNLEHIEKNYGIHIDRDRYSVHYSIIASNIMPNIKVTELVKEKG